jgi:hypothetical protein
VSNGRHKSHHTHEVNDAYADGWDARAGWETRRTGNPEAPEPLNPYVLDEEQSHKLSATRFEAQRREAVQWLNGWRDCGEDLARNDLDPVVDSDFRSKKPLSVEAFEPEEDVGEERDGEDTFSLQVRVVSR